MKGQDLEQLKTFKLSPLKDFSSAVSHHLKTKLWAKILFGFVTGLALGFLLKQDLS